MRNTRWFVWQSLHRLKMKKKHTYYAPSFFPSNDMIQNKDASFCYTNARTPPPSETWSSTKPSLYTKTKMNEMRLRRFGEPCVKGLEGSVRGLLFYCECSSNVPEKYETNHKLDWDWKWLCYTMHVLNARTSYSRGPQADTYMRDWQERPLRTSKRVIGPAVLKPLKIRALTCYYAPFPRRLCVGVYGRVVFPTSNPILSARDFSL